MAQYEFIACYMLANRSGGTLYVGVTSDLVRRMEQHFAGMGSVFAARYGCRALVWFERFPTIADAIAMEKRLKRYRRDWKINVIERSNPEWRDLSIEL
jgi:putative endonuclease